MQEDVMKIRKEEVTGYRLTIEGGKDVLVNGYDVADKEEGYAEDLLQRRIQCGLHHPPDNPGRLLQGGMQQQQRKPEGERMSSRPCILTVPTF
jgi:hypothetical protein